MKTDCNETRDVHGDSSRNGWENTSHSRHLSDRRICCVPPAHELRENETSYLGVF